MQPRALAHTKGEKERPEKATEQSVREAGGNWKAECWELKERKILKKDKGKYSA